MRTYSHAVLSLAAARLSGASTRGALLCATGAALPDAPALLGAGWLWTERRVLDRASFEREVCGRSRFRLPDAAAHSFVSLAALSGLAVAAGRPGTRAFLLGWAGHLAVDSLLHGSDARAQLWPVSGWRFRSPVSYRERGRHGRVVSAVEHALVGAAIAVLALRRGPRRAGLR